MLVTLSVLIVFFITACSPEGSYTETTIYTPNGTAVTALKISSELSSSQIREYDAYATDNFPNTYKLRSSSTYYNCHSYSWHSQSSANSYWINSPEQEKYWDDGSYSFKTSTSGSIPSNYSSNKIFHVSYVNDDHSAIIYTSKTLASKWGAGPVMVHAPDDCPYDSSKLDYYT